MQLTASDLLSKIFSVKQCKENVRELQEQPNDQHEDDDAVSYTSFVAGECKIVTDGIEILFGWDASANFSSSYNDAHDFEVTLGSPEYWEIKGATLVDEDGEELLSHEWRDALREVIESTEWEIHVKEMLPKPEVTVIEEDNVMSEDTEIKEYEVERDNGPTIKFKGYVIGSAASSSNNAHPNYSGQAGRSRELTLFKTVGGKYICEDIGYSQWQGERNRYKAAICTTPAEVQAFFGHGWLAKQLYADADLDASEHVE